MAKDESSVFGTIGQGLGWLPSKTWRAVKFGGRQLFAQSHLYNYVPGEGPVQAKGLQRMTLERQYEAFDQLANAAVDGVKVPRNLDCLGSIDTYLNERSIALQKALNGTPMLALSDGAGANPLKNEFNALKKMLAAGRVKGNKIGAYSLTKTLIELKSTAKKRLDAQLKSDIEQINNSTGYTPAIKANLIKALEDNHATAFKKLEESLEKAVETERHNARSENARLFLIQQSVDLAQRNDGYFYGKSAATQALLEQLKLLAEEGAKKNQTTISVRDGAILNPKDFRYVDLDQIKEFTSEEGITYNKTGPSEYQIHIPWTGYFWFHNTIDGEDNVLKGLKRLAHLILQSGATEITFEITGENQKEIEALARKAYQAAIEAGFPGGKDGKIKIVVNGAELELLDSKDKDGKLVKGVFRNQRELDELLRAGEGYEQTRLAREAQDEAFKLDVGAENITLEDESKTEKIELGNNDVNLTVQPNKEKDENQAMFEAMGSGNDDAEEFVAEGQMTLADALTALRLDKNDINDNTKIESAYKKAINDNKSNPNMTASIHNAYTLVQQAAARPVNTKFISNHYKHSIQNLKNPANEAPLNLEKKSSSKPDLFTDIDKANIKLAQLKRNESPEIQAAIQSVITAADAVERAKEEEPDALEAAILDYEEAIKDVNKWSADIQAAITEITAAIEEIKPGTSFIASGSR